MPTTTPLPVRFRAGTFRTGNAIRHEVSWARLARAGLAHVSHGVWSARAPETDEDLVRAMAAALHAAGAYSHVTAAAVQGLSASRASGVADPVRRHDADDGRAAAP